MITKVTVRLMHKDIEIAASLDKSVDIMVNYFKVSAEEVTKLLSMYQDAIVNNLISTERCLGDIWVRIEIERGVV